MIPITFRRILLVRVIPHVKYMRLLCTYITGRYHYVNPAWTNSKPITIIELFSTVYIFAEVIIICICSVVQHAILPPMIKGILTSYVYPTLDSYNLYLVTGGASHCKENYVVLKT